MSNPGAGVSGIVYLRFSVKTDHWSMSWRLIPLLGPISIWSFFICGCGVGWGIWSAVIVFCWGSGSERLSIAPILLASLITKASYGIYIGLALRGLWLDPLSYTHRGVQPVERTGTQFHALVSVRVSPHPWATSWCCRSHPLHV